MASGVPGGAHMGVEEIGRLADGPDGATPRERGHIEACAVCRAEIDRASRVRAILADLGAAYRDAAPPEWPALGSVLARAEDDAAAKGGLRAVLAGWLRPRRLLVATAAGVACVAVVVWIAFRVVGDRPASGRGGGVAAAVAAGPDGAGPGAVRDPLHRWAVRRYAPHRPPDPRGPSRRSRSRERERERER